MPRSAVYCPLLLFLTVTLPAGAQEATPLTVDVAVTRELGPGQRHSFSLMLDANQFVVGQADQISIDVVIRIFGPDGARIGEFDSPARGPEPFSFSAAEAGRYRIAVLPFQEDETGEYAIRIDRVEPPASTPEGRIDQLFAAWDRAGSPGASVAVARHGEILYEAGYGRAQLEYDIPITASTIFHVASVSKQFTAFAVTLLAVEGRLSLDDDIRIHLPELPDFGEAVTVRHLIHHISGVRDQWALLALGGWRLDDVITRDQIMRLLTRQQELNFTPGDEYMYSNSGYTLLAEIVERVSGQTFPEWTAEHLFAPLGMTGTHFHNNHQMIVPDRAYSYSYSADGLQKAVLSYANAGATSLFTTAGDLARWMHNLETGTVGGPDVLEWMHTRGVLNSGDTIGYAFGLGIGEYRGLRTVGHGGADAGFRSNALRFPEQGLSVVVLSNLGSFNPGGLARRVAEIYLEDEMASAEPAEEPAEEEAEETDEITVDGELLDAYAGEYDLAVGGLRIVITHEGDQLTGQATGQPTVVLVPRSDSVFLIAEAPAEVTFVREASGAVNRLIIRQGGQEIEGRRVGTAEAAPVDLTDYVGIYDSPELETTYTLVVRNDTLVAEHVRHDPIRLGLLARDNFRGSTWFFGGTIFERNDTGAITGMRVSSGRVRSLLFVKRTGDEVRR